MKSLSSIENVSKHYVGRFGKYASKRNEGNVGKCF